MPSMSEVGNPFGTPIGLCCDVVCGKALSFGPAPYAVVPLLLPPSIHTIDIRWCLNLFSNANLLAAAVQTTSINYVWALSPNYDWLKYRYSQRGPCFLAGHVLSHSAGKCLVMIYL
jgi:hypothetical protein